MSYVADAGKAKARRTRKRVIRVVTVGELVSAVGEHGILLPVGLAAVLRGCSKQAVRSRMSRGSVIQFVVLGQQFVSLRQLGGVVS